MREVYNIFGVITKEEQRYFAFKHFVPEINSVAFSFEKPKSNMISSGNIIEEMNILFENYECLTIEGIYLHKFFTTPPTNVSTDEENYIANNPYLDNYTTENMIELIRKSFLYLLDEYTPETKVERLKSLLIEYSENGCNVIKELYSSLSENAQNEIKNLLKFSINNNTKLYDEKFLNFVKDSLLKPKIESKMVREGEYLRNSFTEVEWGDVSQLEFKDFLISLDAYREENIPFYTSYMDRLKELSKVHSTLILTELLGQIEEQNNELYTEVYDYFIEINIDTLKNKDFDIKKAAEFLIADEETGIGTVLFDYWWDKYYGKNISEIIS